MAKNHCLWHGSSVIVNMTPRTKKIVRCLTLFESLLFFRCFKISDTSSVRFFETLNTKKTQYAYCTCRIMESLHLCRSHLKYRNRKLKSQFHFFLVSYFGLYKYKCIYHRWMLSLLPVQCCALMSWVGCQIYTDPLLHISSIHTDPHFTAKNMQLAEQIHYTGKNKGRRRIEGTME
jgi:hypothetical protein